MSYLCHLIFIYYLIKVSFQNIVNITQKGDILFLYLLKQLR